MKRNTNIKEGYKKTAVGVIPEEWEAKKIGEVCTLKSGGTPSRKKEVYWNGTIPWITTTLVDFNIISEAQEYITIDGLNNSSAHIFPKGTTIMAIYGQGVTRGKVARLGIDASTNQACVAFLNDNISFQDYLFYSLSYQYLQLRNLSNDGSQKNLSSSILRNYKLPIPPLPEQQAIANCLTTWDKGIVTLTALIEAKQEQKKGLMQQLLIGKKRMDGFTGEWEEVKLGDYFKERNERGLNDLDLLSVGEEGVYPQSESNKRDTSNEDKSKYKLIEKGDIGYNTMRLWQGRIALSSIRGIVSPAYTIVIPQVNKVDTNFFSYLFKMSSVIHLFYRSSQGMVSDTLTCRYNDFKKIKLIVPTKEEQTAIANILSTADQEISLLKKKLEAMKEEKKGVMQVLLTGEKRLV